MRLVTALFLSVLQASRNLFTSSKDGASPIRSK